jgi:hypothetical protein
MIFRREVVPAATERRKGPLARRGLKGKKGSEREKRGFSFFFSFKFFFQIHFSNIQTSIKNPCIQIMMHKHLLFLNYFSDV